MIVIIRDLRHIPIGWHHFRLFKEATHFETPTVMANFVSEFLTDRKRSQFF
jgi:hypothetical protein